MVLVKHGLRRVRAQEPPKRDSSDGGHCGQGEGDPNPLGDGLVGEEGTKERKGIQHGERGLGEELERDWLWGKGESKPWCPRDKESAGGNHPATEERQGGDALPRGPDQVEGDIDAGDGENWGRGSEAGDPVRKEPVLELGEEGIEENVLDVRLVRASLKSKVGKRIPGRRSHPSILRLVALSAHEPSRVGDTESSDSAHVNKEGLIHFGGHKTVTKILVEGGRLWENDGLRNLERDRIMRRVCGR